MRHSEISAHFEELILDPALLPILKGMAVKVVPYRLRRDIDDIIQEALLRAFVKKTSFRGSSLADLIAWMLAIIKHIAIDCYRRQKANPEVHADEATMTLHSRSVRSCEDNPSYGSNVSIVRDLLEFLTPRQRDVVILRISYELPAKEVAEFLKISDVAVRQTLFKAVRKLQKVAERVHANQAKR